MPIDRPTPAEPPDEPHATRHTPGVKFPDGNRPWNELELSQDVHTAWDHEGIAEHPERPSADKIHLPPERRVHILDSDERGGGHLYGTGIVGKCEFPQHWDENQVVAAVLHTAHRPQTAELNRNGRWELSRTQNDVKVWTVVETDGRIWTAYPDKNSPGVTRNPLPRRSH